MHFLKHAAVVWWVHAGGGFLPPAQYISRIRCIQCSTYNKFIGAILRRYTLYYVDGHGYTWNVLFAPRCRRGNNMNLIFMEVAVRLWLYFLLKHPIRYILLLLQHLLRCVKRERTERFSDLYTFLNNLLYTIGTRVTDFKRFGDNILKCVYCIPDIIVRWRLLWIESTCADIIDSDKSFILGNKIFLVVSTNKRKIIKYFYLIVRNIFFIYLKKILYNNT